MDYKLEPAIPTKTKRAQSELYTTILFAISSWLFLFSSMYVKNGRTYLGFNYVQILVYFSFGLLTSWIFYLYYTKPLDLYYPELFQQNHPARLPLYKAFRFIVMTFGFTGIWQTVLLPLSGLGVVEYFFVVILLLLMLLNYLTAFSSSLNRKKRYIFCVQNPISIIALQAPLFLIKVASWIAPENFYRDKIEGNKTIRTVIAIVFAIFIVSGIMALFRKMIRITPEDKNRANKIARKLGSAVGKVFSIIFTFVLGLTRGPIIILIVSFIVPIVITIVLNILRSDLLNFIEPIFIFFASTGKHQVQTSSTFIICQIVVLLLYILFIIFQDIRIDEGNLKIYLNDFESKLKDLTPEEQEKAKEKLEAYFSADKKEFMYNYASYQEKILKEIKTSDRVEEEVQ